MKYISWKTRLKNMKKTNKVPEIVMDLANRYESCALGEKAFMCGIHPHFKEAQELIVNHEAFNVPREWFDMDKFSVKAMDLAMNFWFALRDENLDGAEEIYNEIQELDCVNDLGKVKNEKKTV